MYFEIVLVVLIVVEIICWTLQLRQNKKEKEIISACDLIVVNLGNRVQKVHDKVADLEQKKAFEETLQEIRTFIANQKSPVTKEKLSEYTIDKYVGAIKAYLSGKTLKDTKTNRRAMALYKQHKEFQERK